MTVEAWALFCLTETFLCLSPGPSALVVIGLGVSRGRRAGTRAALGVLAANAVYFALTASGLAALHRLSAEAFLVVKWAGAAYLVAIGTRAIVRSFRRTAPAAEVVRPPEGRAFWRGFVVQGANPNLLVYFSAILPQFVDPTAPLAPQVAVLACSSFAIEMTVLSAWAALASGAGRRTAPRFGRAVERVGGGLLVAAGAGLARMSRE